MPSSTHVRTTDVVGTKPPFEGGTRAVRITEIV